ncbi:MAG: hypothetical protein J6J60_07705 [Clostridia bacterium]|nr:hypothetical protein [Clostridia bacterium]
MFGLKKKAYPETFHYDPGTLTRFYPDDATVRVMQVLDTRLKYGKNTYKGRFVGKFKSQVELEEFKGVILLAAFFEPKDAYGNCIR